MKKSIRRIVKGTGLALALTLALLVTNALAVGPPDTIVNPSFETGDYTGWTLWEGTQNCPSCGTWGIASAGQTINSGDLAFDYFDGVNVVQSGPGWPHTFTPTDGNYTAFQAQQGPQTHRMYQDIDLRTCRTLSWDLSYDNHNGAFDPNNQFIAMYIRDTSDVIQQTLYKTTQNVDPLVLPTTTFTRDVSAYRGSTIRLDLTLQVQLFFFDAFVIDNFRLDDCALDDFNRHDTKLGSNWSGEVWQGNYLLVNDSEVEVMAGGAAYWKDPAFGQDQEAFVTLTKLDNNGHHTVLLKVQPRNNGKPNWKRGVIAPFYNTEGPNTVGIETYVPGQGWNTLFSTGMTLSPGDVLGGRALADGTVEVLVNGAVVGSANAPFFANKGGHIGVWFIGHGHARFDDFGGR